MGSSRPRNHTGVEQEEEHTEACLAGQSDVALIRLKAIKEQVNYLIRYAEVGRQSDVLESVYKTRSKEMIMQRIRDVDKLNYFVFKASEDLLRASGMFSVVTGSLAEEKSTHDMLNRISQAMDRKVKAMQDKAWNADVSYMMTCADAMAFQKRVSVGRGQNNGKDTKLTVSSFPCQWKLAFGTTGPSMEPNIRSHDILLTEHISPRTGNLHRGDIIVARSPTNPMQFICKRVVALPGDHLLQTDGALQHVPKGHIWIEGDNTDNSTDSRSYGPIPMGLVRGRALVRVWPLTDATMLVPPRGKELD